jgi:hypothetical protein
MNRGLRFDSVRLLSLLTRAQGRSAKAQLGQDRGPVFPEAQV